MLVPVRVLGLVAEFFIGISFACSVSWYSSSEASPDSVVDESEFELPVSSELVVSPLSSVVWCLDVDALLTTVSVGIAVVAAAAVIFGVDVGFSLVAGGRG